MLDSLITSIKKNKPLIHSITNYVSAKDCANVILSLGASPIMADCILEVEEITASSQCLILNTGTLNEEKHRSMLFSGKVANRLGIPVVLDPVGAGASSWRREAIMQLLQEIGFDVIRGNISEIKSLCSKKQSGIGVDADERDLCDDKYPKAALDTAQNLSKSTGAVVVISGKLDILAYHNKSYSVANGHPYMSSITGGGCMLTSMIGAFCGANPDRILASTLGALIAFGYCGEIAAQKMDGNSGFSTFHLHLIDEIRHLSDKKISTYGKITPIAPLPSSLTLYAITDTHCLHGRSLKFAVEEALKGGISVLQLRDKSSSTEELTQTAKDILPLCQSYGVPLIINDDVQATLDSHAQGVHIGQKDGNLASIRKILGPHKILGVSARTVEQALFAEKCGADYLGVGAVFPTSTKNDAQCIPLETLHSICSAVSIPVVAIGGIKAENARTLSDSKIAGICAISSIFAQQNIREATEQLRDIAYEITWQAK